MTSKGGQGGVLRADAARNRALLLRAARDQLAAGDDSLQLNAIARLAGVGVGTAYRHFPTPHALREALSADRFRELVAEAEAAAGEEDPVAGLRRVLRFVLASTLADGGFAAVLVAAEDAEAATSALKKDLDLAVAHLLDRARAAGAVRRDVEAGDLRRLLCGVEHALRAGEAGPARTELYLAVLVEGLRPPR
ncbi:TetR/AcrR family transcriptional regulator [Kitasatospora sp. MMS16-BH015]|uniref:TetR/AcrR family transcriptional regulator n=1 Tax=Kitasatospora sp. MMS16-BH015 TaxID=2018025 RepID=UPI0020C2C12B|nr:TetR family transcriptional regulator [Kitasatospora sp. MMS16-BH015]